MKRIRNLGLAALLVVALTASVGTASASASAFVPSGSGFPQYPATILGEATKDTTIEIAGTSIYYQCDGSPQELGLASAVEGPFTRLDHSGSAVECEGRWSFGFFDNATLEPNGCGTVFHSGAETAPGKFSASVDIGPNAGAAKCTGPIKINGSKCDVLIPAQTGLTGATLTNQENAGADSVIASMSSMVQLSLENCQTIKSTSGTYHGRWEPKARNIAGEGIDLRVDQTGVYTSGKAFEAETYPVWLVGKQDSGSQHQLGFSGRTLKCASITFDGQATGSSADLALDAAYEGCTATVLNNGLPAEVEMNSCHYVFDVAGTLDVACANKEDGIEVLVYADVKNQEAGTPSCAYKVAAQAGAGSVGYSTVGEGSARKVGINLNVASLSYTRTVGTTLLCGAKTSTATYTGGSTVGGAI